ncbi:MAG: hypothetical protein EZS28_024152 [Streblomastix strix]|uniref:Uncharacterized protein n=1 Tax=Streblomastix strix TaxID=222440 RepID=A0A5J4VCX6_9EUKA|nr:MAG: hypothetical protein EZS28_024152 [Streblomastix strix]
MTNETFKDHMHKSKLKGFDLILVGKDDEGQYWPDFSPGVPHAADWRKSNQQGLLPSTQDVKADMNRVVGNIEPLEEETRIIKEEDRATMIEINNIKKDIGMRKITNRMLSRTSIGQ